MQDLGKQARSTREKSEEKGRKKRMSLSISFLSDPSPNMYKQEAMGHPYTKVSRTIWFFFPVLDCQPCTYPS